MNRNNIEKIIILGGGTAGWMTASALSKHFIGLPVSITLVESEAIGTVGVGESTIPHIRSFNQFLGIDENTFIAETKATFKLGIRFNHWGNLGDDYIHPFGPLGHDINGVDFHHYWLRTKIAGNTTPIDHYSLAAVAARAGRFQPPVSDETSILSNYSYAFHFDAALYALYLRRYSEARGVVRREGKMLTALVSSHSGFIESITLDDGATIGGDLFIDCTGFRGLLIDEILKVEFDDWSQWLACNRAIAVPCEKDTESLKPFTLSIAHTAGWQWRIPLQHRTGNGHVYCSDYMSDDEATSVLLNNLGGTPLAEPKMFSFTAGQRKQNWKKNCVAIGLSSGFLEPLESTSIYLIQVGIQKLLEFFPDKDFVKENTAEFNRHLDAEYSSIRDFIIMHYKENTRTDSDFWIRCRHMTIPDGLAQRQKHFSDCGFVDDTQYGVYAAVCLGQGLIPQTYDEKINRHPIASINQYLEKIQADIQAAVNTMPLAVDYIRDALKRAGTGTS
jgi:tryptophan 7-halogenase